jgi:hypothetical protein
MESKMPLSANAQRIADDVMLRVNAQDETSFVELDQGVPGFRARRRQDGRATSPVVRHSIPSSCGRA